MKGSAAAAINAITQDKFVYLRLKALIWLYYGLAFPANLRSSAGQALAAFWSAIPEKKILIVNCQGISAIDQHAVEQIRKKIEAEPKRRILFFSDNPTFLGDLDDALGAPTGTINLPNQVKGYTYGSESLTPTEIKRLIAEAQTQERLATERIVAECFEPHRNGKLVRLHSTPIRASGIFNARALITNRRHFCAIALQLSERLEALLQKFQPRNPCVMAVSLRGSPIAAAASFLASPRVDVEIVDHMGPKQALLEHYSFGEARSGIDYIYVGDFLIGGTEVKVASSYACAHGSQLTHALVIGSLLEPRAYSAPTHIEALVRLDDCKSDLRYEVMEE